MDFHWESEQNRKVRKWSQVDIWPDSTKVPSCFGLFPLQVLSKLAFGCFVSFVLEQDTAR